MEINNPWSRESYIQGIWGSEFSCHKNVSASEVQSPQTPITHSFLVAILSDLRNP